MSAQLHALSGSGGADVWAHAAPNQTPSPGALLHFDGAAWTAHDTGLEERVRDLWTSPSGKLWTAGGALRCASGAGR